MFCTNCGNEIYDDAVYCNYCGNKIIIEDKEEPVEDKEEIKEEPVEDIFKDINIPEISRTSCIIVSIIGLLASAINIVNLYFENKDISYMLGQIITVLIFVISIILLWKSKKIGGIILILFILFKMISSIYYYIEIPYEYFIKNLVVDEIFYLVTICLIVISWKTLK